MRIISTFPHTESTILIMFIILHTIPVDVNIVCPFSVIFLHLLNIFNYLSNLMVKYNYIGVKIKEVSYEHEMES